MMKRTMNVCVTGACGNIAFALYSLLCSGEAFGSHVDINLRLLDVQSKLNHLKALKIELEDCAFNSISSIQIATEYAQAFQDADFIIFLGSRARRPGMERQEFYHLNAQIFTDQGKALDICAKKTCKSLVVANPTSTNCMALASNAPSIPSQNFTFLMRLDSNRVTSQIAQLFECSAKKVKNHIIWGTHSVNQFRDFSFLQVEGVQVEAVQKKSSQKCPNELSKKIADRNNIVIDITGSGYLSSAKSIMDHVFDWMRGSNNIVSMGVVIKTEKYGVKAGIAFSMPVMCFGNGQYKIMEDLTLNEVQKRRIQQCQAEIQKERSFVSDLLDKRE